MSIFEKLSVLKYFRNMFLKQKTLYIPVALHFISTYSKINKFSTHMSTYTVLYFSKSSPHAVKQKVDSEVP